MRSWLGSGLGIGLGLGLGLGLGVDPPDTLPLAVGHIEAAVGRDAWLGLGLGLVLGFGLGLGRQGKVRVSTRVKLE